MISLRVLECSSKGDSRFSSFYAKIEVYGKFDSIENHYQLCKRFGDEIPNTWRDAKGKQPTHISINNIDLDVKYLSQYFDLLWCKYLDNNPELVNIAKTYDDFTDMFKGSSINCQADSIRKYIKEGRKSIIESCRYLLDALSKNK